jgi:hypothetical protein
MSRCVHSDREEVAEVLRTIARKVEKGDLDSLKMCVGKEVTEFSMGEGKPIFRYPTGKETLKLTWMDTTYHFGAEA